MYRAASVSFRISPQAWSKPRAYQPFEEGAFAMYLRALLNHKFDRSRLSDRPLLGLSVMIVLAVILSGNANAQSTFGSFLGTVVDQSGQIIVGATATLTNLGTSATKTAKSDRQGTYSFLNVDPGTYSITIAADGFQQGDF
jgi:hypothetical protein